MRALWLLLCSLLLWAAVLPAPLCAQELRAAARPPLPEPARGYRVEDHGALTLELTESARPLAERVVRSFARAKARVELKLGALVPPRPHAIVAPTDRAFQRRCQGLGAGEPGQTVLALAFPSEHLILIRGSGIREGTEAGLEKTLTHELAHLALASVERQRGARLPRWLNEGLCELAAGRVLSDQEQSSLSGWAKVGPMPRVATLSRSFPLHGSGAPQIYLLSAGFVLDLDARVSAKRLVAALARDRDTERVFRELYAASIEDCELDWRARLVEEHRSWKTLLYSVEPWSIAALLCVLAGLRLFWKRRGVWRRLELEDEDEEPLDPDAEPPEWALPPEGELPGPV